MDITPPIPDGRQVINSYSDGGFSISGTDYTGSVIVLPDQVLTWGATDVASLHAAQFEELLAIEPRIELLLIGCGARFAMVGPEVRRALKKEQVSIESMDTGAACRTYNVLLGEDRRVGAALIPAGS